MVSPGKHVLLDSLPLEDSSLVPPLDPLVPLELSAEPEGMSELVLPELSTASEGDSELVLLELSRGIEVDPELVPHASTAVSRALLTQTLRNP